MPDGGAFEIVAGYRRPLVQHAPHDPRDFVRVDALVTAEH
jgi:hypothetical protein